MQFRKKPIPISAEQFFVDKKPWPEGVNGCADGKGCDRKHHWIGTLEGPLFVSDGDWIITGVEGEKYPCKPHIFKATYEAVE